MVQIQADRVLGRWIGFSRPKTHKFERALNVSFYEINGLDPHAYPAQSVTQASLFYSLELNALHTLFPIWLSQFLYVYSLLFYLKWAFTRFASAFPKSLFGVARLARCSMLTALRTSL
jgi:hypothetical protein